MPRRTLGRWGRWYASSTEDLAHYTDRQFRAWANVFARAVRNEGELPKLRPLKALEGADEIDFLVSEGMLAVDAEGHVTIPAWSVYQAPVDRTNAARQARYRESLRNGGAPVDNASPPVSNAVTVTGASYSTSTNVTNTSEDGATEPVAREGFDESDPFDAFYLITLQYPNSPRLKTWIRDTVAAGPSPRDFFVVLKTEFEKSHDVTVAMKATKAKLAQMTERAERAKAKAPRAADPLQGELKAAMLAKYGDDDYTVEPDPEAGRKLQKAFGNGNGKGLASVAASLLGSMQGAPARGLSLTADEGSDTESAAVGSLGPQNSDRSPSPAGNGARLQSDTEPGERMTDQPHKARPTVG